MQLLERFQLTVSRLVGNIISAEQGVNVLQASLLLLVGVLLYRLSRTTINRNFATLTRQQRMLLRRSVSYTLFTLFLISALRELGFDFTVLIGAAGIVSVALGFASQTSASNLISGLFLVFERVVEVGDIIRVDGTTGEVLSVDLLSTKLRTFDNLLVRIPNETMVKTQITNLNRFPIRRIDLQIGVAYKEDLARVQQALLDVAEENPLALDDPAPLLIAQGFGNSSVNYQFSVWGRRENYLELRNGLQEQVKLKFDLLGIEIPYPHLSLYSGTNTAPLPLKLVRDGEASEDAGDSLT